MRPLECLSLLAAVMAFTCVATASTRADVGCVSPVLAGTQSADAIFALPREVNQWEGTTVLVVTHTPLRAARCDRTISVIDVMSRLSTPLPDEQENRRRDPRVGVVAGALVQYALVSTATYVLSDRCSHAIALRIEPVVCRRLDPAQPAETS